VKRCNDRVRGFTPSDAPAFLTATGEPTGGTTAPAATQQAAASKPLLEALEVSSIASYLASAAAFSNSKGNEPGELRARLDETAPRARASAIPVSPRASRARPAPIPSEPQTRRDRSVHGGRLWWGERAMKYICVLARAAFSRAG
jgi:hypothetical protein